MYICPYGYRWTYCSRPIDTYVICTILWTPVLTPMVIMRLWTLCDLPGINILYIQVVHNCSSHSIHTPAWYTCTTTRWVALAWLAAPLWLCNRSWALWALHLQWLQYRLATHSPDSSIVTPRVADEFSLWGDYAGPVFYYIVLDRC